MRAVFGHPFSLLWFSPFSTPDHGKAETYQYVVWELSAGNEVGRGQNKKNKKKNGGKRPVQPHRAQLWQSAAPNAERQFRCVSHARHGQLSSAFCVAN